MPPQAIINPLLDKLDITPHPRPFKATAYKAHLRRNKNLKQILADDVRSAAASGTATPSDFPTSSTKSTDPLRLARAAAAAAAAGEEVGEVNVGIKRSAGAMSATYQNIESAPSLKRARKYCDITGREAKYTDPKSKLRYRDMEAFQAVRGLPAGAADRYLEVRGANVVLK